MLRTPPEYHEASIPRVRCDVNYIRGSKFAVLLPLDVRALEQKPKRKGRSLGTTGLL